jgi:hypothetical protein
MKPYSTLTEFALHGFALLALLGLPLAPLRAAAPTPPDRMTYQGYLVDANGVALATNSPANYSIVFRIYDAAQGGTILWAEQQIATVDKGNFSVVLGEGTQYESEPRDALSGVFSSVGAADRYLGISVTIGTTTAEIAPRLRLLPAPYAFLARSANALVGTDGAPLLTTATGGALNAGGSISAGANITATGDVTAGGSLNATAMNVTGTATATTFVGNGTIPIGGIIMWSGSTVPAGWALCDGSSYAPGRSTPNLRDKFIVGASSTYPLNTAGGSATRTLIEANLPPHTHSYTDSWFEQWSDYWWGTFPGGAYVGHTREASKSTGSVGSATSFSIIPPYYALAFIMRIQ